jgi:hypothetical protein
MRDYANPNEADKFHRAQIGPSYALVARIATTLILAHESVKIEGVEKINLPIPETPPDMLLLYTHAVKTLDDFKKLGTAAADDNRIHRILANRQDLGTLFESIEGPLCRVYVGLFLSSLTLDEIRQFDLKWLLIMFKDCLASDLLLANICKTPMTKTFYSDDWSF